MYKIELSKEAQKIFKKIPQAHSKRILSALKKIQKHPLSGKKLQGKYQGAYSTRAWPYRIIYIIQKKKLLVSVIDIKHRQTSYHP